MRHLTNGQPGAERAIRCANRRGALAAISGAVQECGAASPWSNCWSSSRSSRFWRACSCPYSREPRPAPNPLPARTTSSNSSLAWQVYADNNKGRIVGDDVGFLSGYAQNLDGWVLGNAQFDQTDEDLRAGKLSSREEKLEPSRSEPAGSRPCPFQAVRPCIPKMTFQRQFQRC